MPLPAPATMRKIARASRPSRAGARHRRGDRRCLRNCQMLPPLLDVESIRSRLQVIFPEGTPERAASAPALPPRARSMSCSMSERSKAASGLPRNTSTAWATRQAAKTSDAERAAYLAAVKKPGTPEPPTAGTERTRGSRSATRRSAAVSCRSVRCWSIRMFPRHRARAATFARRSRRTVRSALSRPTVRTSRGRPGAARSLTRTPCHGEGAAGRRHRRQGESAGDAAERRRPRHGSGSVFDHHQGCGRGFRTRAFLPIRRSCGFRRAARRSSRKTTSFCSCSASRSVPKSCCPTSSSPILARRAVVCIRRGCRDRGADTRGTPRGTAEADHRRRIQPEQAAFLTAFQSRDHAAFKKMVASLAWGSFAWCFSEPEHLIAFDGRNPAGIELLRDFLPR